MDRYISSFPLMGKTKENFKINNSGIEEFLINIIKFNIYERRF